MGKPTFHKVHCLVLECSSDLSGHWERSWKGEEWSSWACLDVYFPLKAKQGAYPSKRTALPRVNC